MSVINKPNLDRDQIVDKYGSEAVKRLTEMVKSLSQEGRKQLNEKLKSIVSPISPQGEEQALADAIAGKTYSAEEIKELKLLNLMNSFAQRAKLLQDTISSTEVAELLSCRSRQTPLDRVKNQTLIAVKDNGQWRYPLWQFDSEGEDGVVYGLPETIQTLQVSNLAKVSWLTLPISRFYNLTPVQMLKKGATEQVLNEAIGVGLTQ